MKKLIAMIMTCIFALGICLPTFVAEPVAAAETQLTDAIFVKNNGKPLPMGMGTGVIVPEESTYNSETGDIKVKLQPYTKEVLPPVWEYTGSITEAYYADTNGNPINTINLVSNGYLNLNTSQKVTMPDGVKNGFRLVLHFDMQPSNPPGMPNPVVAYFTCGNC